MALGLIDALAPYFFAGVSPGSAGGIDLGGIYDDVVGAMQVLEIDGCWDDDAVCLWGQAGIGDPTKAHHQANGQIYDWHDTNVRFRLTAARAESQTFASAVAGMSGSATLATLIDALGGNTNPSDAPTSTFRLDLLVTAVTLHLPHVRPATLSADGVLVPDTSTADVQLVLPKLLFTVTQGATVGSVSGDFDSWGATGLDTEADLAAGTAITQNPPYALGGSDNSLWGWGFRSAVLDFSDSYTPPEILATAGIGDDWKGIYLPELRVFVAPSGIRGLAVDVGVRDLLIGVQPTFGLAGDLIVDVVNQQGAVDPSVRFQSTSGNTVHPDWTGVDHDGNQIGTAKVAADGTLIVDVAGGQPPYTVTINGATAPTRSLAYTALADGTVFTVTVSDSGPDRPGKTWSAKITAHPTAPAASSGTSTSSSTGTAQLTFPAMPANRQVAVSPGADDDHVVVTVSPAPTSAAPVSLTLDEVTQTAPGADGKVTIALAHDDTTAHTVTVSWAGTPVPIAQTVYFVRDLPIVDPGYSSDDAWADVGLMHTDPVPDGAASAGAVASVDGLRSWAASFPTGTTFTVVGQASHDSVSASTPHNVQLAKQRGMVGAAALDHGVAGGGQATAATGVYDPSLDAAGTQPSLRRAVVTASQAAPDTSANATGTLQRVATSPPVHVETPPGGKVEPPSWFRSIEVTVRWVMGSLVPVAFEVKGVVRFADLADKQLQAQDSAHQLPAGGPAGVTGSGAGSSGGTNPADRGLVGYDLTVEWDAGNGDFRVDFVFAGANPSASGAGGGTGSGGSGGSDPNAVNWIWQSPPLPGTDAAPAPDGWRDFAGLLTALTPVLTLAAGSGDPVQGAASIAIGTGVVVVVTLLDIVHTKTLTLWGGEMLVERAGESWHAALMLDLEADLWFDVAIGSVKLLSLPPASPMKVRYNAVGVGFGEDDGAMTLGPVFDASRGYELTVPDASAFTMPDPLGQILHLLAVRIARLNPLQIEADLGLKADLGVVSVDRARVRLTLPESDGDGLAVTITALAASVNIPGVLVGKGSLAIDDTGFDGSLDLALTALGLRVAATLSVRHVEDGDRSLTAVFASIEVDFPAPIPLLQSGLGIYGLLGLFGMHYATTQAPPGSSDNPALDWLAKAAPGGDISKLTGPAPANTPLWQPMADHWAIGLGIVLGTMDGGTILNLKGVVVVELPGPTLLIYVKAQFLQPRPSTNSQLSGASITAVLEISPDAILIGLIVDYESLAPLLRLRVPVGAHFDLHQASDFQIDVGTYPAPATATVLSVFTATAFVEIHGDQISDVTPLVQELGGPLPGLAIAAGIHAGIVWGSKSSGLYLEVTADAVVGVSFSPFQFLGIFTLSGALHLWIVAIEASASLDLGALTVGDSTQFWLSGDVCGEVDFLFFSVKGCVHVELGDTNPLAPAPPLVNGLILQARTSSPVQGTATADRPAGAALATASPDPAHPDQPAQAAGTVPIDAIPVLDLMTAPSLDAGFTTIGTPPAPAPLAQGTGWARRGQAEYSYTLTAVTLAPSGGAAMTADGVQSVFRTGNRTTGDDTSVQYALLDWSPDPADQVMLAGPANDNRVGDDWGWVCTPVADPVAVLWTFQPCPPGPNPDGWQVTGTPFPDPPGTRRSQPAPATLSVHEPWRTGLAWVDSMAGVEPARIDQILAVAPHVALAARLTPVRALAAPFERPLTARGDPLDEIAKQLRQAADTSPTARGLVDAVTLSAGAARHVRMLVTVAGAVLKSRLFVLRCLDEHGQPLGGDLPIAAGSASTPPVWTDPGFPAAADVDDALAYAARSQQSGHTPVLVDTDLPDGTVTLVLGLTEAGAGLYARQPWPVFTVCVVELGLVAEQDRAGQDQQDADDAGQTLGTAMTSDPARRPLLAPGTGYTVTVAYTWQGRHVGDATVAVSGSASQQFGFDTDSTAPTSLEPWLLCTSPADGDAFCFTGDQPVVCFASDDVDQLVGTYGRALHAQVVPARADLVRSVAPFGPFRPIPAVFRGTFEQTLVRLHDQGVLPCIDVTPGPRHGQVSVPAPLDPNSAYTLDLSYDAAVATPAPGTVSSPLLRRGFSTGSYATADDLAAAVATVRLEHRLVSGLAAAFAGLGTTPPDTELDTALATIGLGAVAPPSGPRLVLLWETTALPPARPLPLPVTQAVAQSAVRPVTTSRLALHPPLPWPRPRPRPLPVPVTRPVAVLIDAAEPLWRTRQMPQQQTDSTGAIWWGLGSQDWLTVADGPATDAGHVPVTSTVRNAAGTRVVCMLGATPASGTASVHVVLTRSLDPNGLLDPPGATATTATLVQVDVGAPPWEEST